MVTLFVKRKMPYNANMVKPTMQKPQPLQQRGWRYTRVVVLVLLLVAGAVVNVAAAWGLAAWTDQDQWLGEVMIDAPAQWPAYLEEIGWPAPNSATKRTGLAMGVMVIEISGGDADASWERSGPGSDRTWVGLEVRQFGIPSRALQWESHVSRAGPRSLEVVKAAHAAAGLRTGIDISQRNSDGSFTQHYLPLIPLLPGFIINTLFYALLLGVLFFAPPAARRMLRRWRGLCAKCAYPVGVSSVCTECGTAV